MRPFQLVVSGSVQDLKRRPSSRNRETSCVRIPGGNFKAILVENLRVRTHIRFGTANVMVHEAYGDIVDKIADCGRGASRGFDQLKGYSGSVPMDEITVKARMKSNGQKYIQVNLVNLRRAPWLIL